MEIDHFRSALSGEAGLLAQTAREYYRSSCLLRAAEDAKGLNPIHWENRNAIYFLMLHSAELAWKALAHVRGQTPKRTHDIVKLLRSHSQPSDREFFRRAYKDIRSLEKQRLSQRLPPDGQGLSAAAHSMEWSENLLKPPGVIKCYVFLGALGQSEMEKVEFDTKLANKEWAHSARYPRYGTTTFPDYEKTAIICDRLIGLAEREVNSRILSK